MHFPCATPSLRMWLSDCLWNAWFMCFKTQISAGCRVPGVTPCKWLRKLSLKVEDPGYACDLWLWLSQLLGLSQRSKAWKLLTKNTVYQLHGRLEHCLQCWSSLMGMWFRFCLLWLSLKAVGEWCSVEVNFRSQSVAVRLPSSSCRKHDKATLLQATPWGNGKWKLMAFFHLLTCRACC